MNKISVALLTGCLALSGNLALAQGAMSKDTMSMKKTQPGDAMMSNDVMPSGSMKQETMDKGMMKKEGMDKHAMKRKKPKKSIHKDTMDGGAPQNTMQRMQ